MTRRLSILIAVLVLVAVLCVVVLRVAPAPDRVRARRAPATEPTARAPEMPGPYPTEYDEVTVSVEIAPITEFPPIWADNDGCPHNRISRVLGAGVGPSNGCPVVVIEPDGAADRAGIRVFDRLGRPGDCASGIYRFFRPGEETRTVEWTVRRPKGAKVEGGADEAEEQGASP